MAWFPLIAREDELTSGPRFNCRDVERIDLVATPVSLRFQGLSLHEEDVPFFVKLALTDNAVGTEPCLLIELRFM